MTPREPITDKHVGQIVTYFKDGQRFAKLIALKGHTAVLQREGHRKFEVPISDVKGVA